MAGKYLKVNGKWTREEATEEDIKKRTTKSEPVKEEPPKPKTTLADFYASQNLTEIPTEMPTLERSQKRSEERKSGKDKSASPPGKYSHSAKSKNKKSNSNKTKTTKTTANTSKTESSKKQTAKNTQQKSVSETKTNLVTEKVSPNAPEKKTQKKSQPKVSNTTIANTQPTISIEKPVKHKTDANVMVISWEQEEALRIKAAERDGLITGFIMICVMAMTYGIYMLVAQSHPEIGPQALGDRVLYVFLDWIMDFMTGGHYCVA